MELLCRDFLDDKCSFEPVDLVFADLVFEYVDPEAGLKSIKRFVRPRGHLSTILQLPSKTIPAVTPSDFTSLNKLSRVLHLVPPDEFERYAETIGFNTLERKRRRLVAGKEFCQVLLQIPKQ